MSQRSHVFVGEHAPTATRREELNESGIDLTSTRAAARSSPDPCRRTSPSIGRILAAIPGLVAWVAASGCSGGDDDATAISVARETARATGSVLATDITGRPTATTAPPPSSSASTSLAPSDVAASSTAAGSEAALRAAIGDAELALLSALRDPDSEHLLAAVEASTAAGSPARAELVDRYRARVAAGFALEPSGQVPFTITVEGDIRVTGADRAVATVCVVDGDVLLRRQVADGGDEERVVVDDVVTSGRFVEEFTLEDGTWRLSSRELVSAFEGATSCE